jgi:hypothetical protein
LTKAASVLATDLVYSPRIQLASVDLLCLCFTWHLTKLSDLSLAFFQITSGTPCDCMDGWRWQHSSSVWMFVQNYSHWNDQPLAAAGLFLSFFLSFFHSFNSLVTLSSLRRPRYNLIWIPFHPTFLLFYAASNFQCDVFAIKHGPILSDEEKDGLIDFSPFF